MRPHGSAAQLERRRCKALELHRQGQSASAIARRLGTTSQAVGQWLRAYQHGGVDALSAKPVPGRPAKLSSSQRQRLLEHLLKGARSAGFATDLWTCPRIAQLIRDRWRVSYHVDHIPRLMAGLDFSPSKAPGPRQGA
jgi:transposase